jgi:hypothetical protein
VLSEAFATIGTRLYALQTTRKELGPPDAAAPKKGGKLDRLPWLGIAGRRAEAAPDRMVSHVRRSGRLCQLRG